MERLTEQRIGELEAQIKRCRAAEAESRRSGRDGSAARLADDEDYRLARMMEREGTSLAAEARKGLLAEKYRTMVTELLDHCPDDGCWSCMDGSDYNRIDNILSKLAGLLNDQALTDGGTGG